MTTASKKVDSWDDKVASFRAHQKFKNDAADRFRAQGFSEEYIATWEANRLQDEGDIKWTQKGGVREWDRGKVITGGAGDKEEVVLRAGWTQKKPLAFKDS